VFESEGYYKLYICNLFELFPPGIDGKIGLFPFIDNGNKAFTLNIEPFRYGLFYFFFVRGPYAFIIYSKYSTRKNSNYVV
jgi:hypothetical protein